MGDKPIIRIAVPGDTAEEFMQAAAKQFRGDFFVAIDQPVGKFVRIEAPFLNGDVGVRGDAIAMPAVRNGRKGLVIRLVRLDPDSLGIPIQESSKALGIEDEDDAVQEFDSSQSTVASGVSAAVAKSIRAAGNAAPIKPMAASPSPPAGVPKPVAKAPSQPTKLEDLDDEAREAVSEFGEASTKASGVSADIAKQLADDPAPVTPHAVRRTTTPEGGIPKQATPPSGAPAVKSADSPHDKPTVESKPLDKSSEAEPDDEPTTKEEVDEKPAAKEEAKAAKPREEAKAAKPSKEEAKAAKPREEAKEAPEAQAPVAATPSKAPTMILVVLIVVAMGAAAFFLIKGL